MAAKLSGGDFSGAAQFRRAAGRKDDAHRIVERYVADKGAYYEIVDGLPQKQKY